MCALRTAAQCNFLRLARFDVRNNLKGLNICTLPVYPLMTFCAGNLESGLKTPIFGMQRQNNQERANLNLKFGRHASQMRTRSYYRINDYLTRYGRLPLKPDESRNGYI
jgi:hypothetical protein